MEIMHINNLSKNLGEEKILHNISFSIEQGEFVGIIGPNGAGKTTLFKCITGQLSVSEDCISITKYDIAKQSFFAKQSFGYACEPSILPTQLTGKQFLTLILASKNIEVSENEMVFFLDMLSLKHKIEHSIGTYSQGMKQKLSIISALVGKPKLIILDESLNGLDPVSSYHLKNYLKEITGKKESAVLLSSHLIDSIEKYCSKVIMIYEGKLRKIWTREELLQEKKETQKDLEQLFMEIILQ